MIPAGRIYGYFEVVGRTGSRTSPSGQRYGVYAARRLCCGVVVTVTAWHLSVLRRKRRRTCTHCRGKARRVAECRCGAKLDRPYSFGRRKGRCPDCALKVEAKTRRRRVRATLGRVCVSCGITDEKARWSNVRDYCSSCERRKTRNGACSCGAAMRRGYASYKPGERGQPKCPRCPSK